MPEKKTVLHLITGLTTGGGAEKMLVRTLPYLEKTDPVVCSMVPKGKQARQLEEKGVEVHSLNMQSKLDIRGVWRYLRLLNEIQPVVQVNYLIHADLFGRVFGSMYGIERIVSFIRNRHEETHFMMGERLTLQLVDCLVTNSTATMQFYQENYNLPSCREVLPNGVQIPDRDQIDASFLYEEFSINRDETVLTCVARLHPQKDHDTLLEAFGRIREERSDVTLLLCGSGPRSDELQNMTEGLGLEDSVRFLGHRDDVLSVLKMTDLFLLPSRFEGMSNALLEAMAMGCACLVSNIPENTELIEDGENGRVFEVENPDDCYKNIKQLLEEDHERDRLGKRARETVRAYYTADAERERLDAFLSAV